MTWSGEVGRETEHPDQLHCHERFVQQVKWHGWGEGGVAFSTADADLSLIFYRDIVHKKAGLSPRKEGQLAG